MLRLSQGQLTLLEYCPRRFQYTILESLAVPPSPALLEGQQWGDRFHLLMQQRELGLPIDPVLAQDTDLQVCLKRLQVQAPELFDTTGEVFRQSEHGRSIALNDYWFTVVYDLLRQWRDQAAIVDWKTYLKPRAINQLKLDWQTRLYLYVLVATTDFQPSQVAMIYWFVRAQNPRTQATEPQQVRISYTEADHLQTQQDLESLTTQLTRLLSTSESLPKLPLGHPKCETCPFAVRCQRQSDQSGNRVDLLGFDAIAEMAV